MNDPTEQRIAEDIERLIDAIVEESMNEISPYITTSEQRAAWRKRFRKIARIQVEEMAKRKEE